MAQGLWVQGFVSQDDHRLSSADGGDDCHLVNLVNRIFLSGKSQVDGYAGSFCPDTFFFEHFLQFACSDGRVEGEGDGVSLPGTEAGEEAYGNGHSFILPRLASSRI